MKHVKRFLALSLAAALLAGCVSCGNSDEKTSPTGGGSGVDSTGDGGTLRIAMTCAALPNTDSEPTEGQEGYRFVSFQLYDALVKWDASSETEAGKIIPGLATSWEQNPENPKRWTFHLREGVKFHDGTDFNADCVIFALDRVMNPDFEYYSTTCAASVGSFLANIESYAKVDDYTITIDTVQDNNAYLIYDLPYIMIPSMEAVKEKGDGFADAPVGSGPFRFVSKIAGQELVMERNENYWGNVPQIKTLILKPISDASARLAALQSGEVDWAEVVPVESLESLKSQGYQVKLNDYHHAWLYIMNTEAGPFADARVRQAFSMSIDREGLCNDILQGVGTPLAQLMYPGSPWYAEGVEEYTYNPERAKELLAVLADGIDPLTGEVLPYDHVCNKGEIVRALNCAVEELSRRKKRPLPENTGKPWTTEMDDELCRLFDEGMKKKDLCTHFGRTSGSIESRLERLGKL